jgi:hypothetical protein
MTSETTLYPLGLPIGGLEAAKRPANMAYARPEIIALADVLAVTQGSKYHGQLLECADDVYRCSPGVYEADE